MLRKISSMMTNKIYNVPLGCAFLDVVAERFLRDYQDNPLALSDVLFLLPNRRACQSLADAFVRYQGLKPLILPQMQPIADVEEEELQITGFDLSSKLGALSPAISTAERLMLFTKIIMAKPADYGLEKMPAGQAAALASELAALIDEVHQQQLSFDNLYNLVPSEYAVHWQETLKFLQIITDYWPAILADEGKVDAVVRQQQLLRAQLELWQQIRPQKKIVVAGTTAAFPLMRELVKVVSELDNGEVILSGIDKHLSDEDWQEIDEIHPQYELKNLLDYLQISRFDIPDFVSSPCSEREILISEVMRPAKTSDKWRQLSASSFSDAAVKGLYLLDTPDLRTEALSAALLMREMLNEPEKTAALVTTDRNLARRVAIEMARWNIEVDDSAGKPLTLTPVGIFIRQILRVVANQFSPVSLLALMKYPLYANGQSYFDVRRQVREYERYYLRRKGICEEEKQSVPLLTALQHSCEQLVELYEKSSVSVQALLKAHLEVAEKLASTDQKSGEKLLWKGDDGEVAARFFADLLNTASLLGEIDPHEYADWLDVLMAKLTVRKRYGTHPRLKILGPIEARLQHFDRVIIGEVNENSWPQSVKADPWMSRPMKKDFGLMLPEKSIGVQAYDFGALLANQEVFVLRANRVQGTPMVKSRWWMRMETVLSAIGKDIQSLNACQYLDWAVYLDKAQTLNRLLPPAPKPPVYARPRELPASAIENWMRDPYIIFAKYILKLKPLDDLNQGLTFADYGNLVHEVLEQFNTKYCSSYPRQAKEELVKLGEQIFEEKQIDPEVKAFWWPNFLKTVDWLVARETHYREDVAHVYNEIKGQYSFEAPAGKFVVTAKADRVDVLKDGKVNIIDYKTGEARSPKEIEHSYAPQLPIEGLIAAKGGFAELEPAEVNALIYWQLGRKESGIFTNAQAVLQNTYDRIAELVSLFDFEETPYLSKPNPKYAPKYSDYEQLSRIKEIMVTEDN